jgi:hypothetical protein
MTCKLRLKTCVLIISLGVTTRILTVNVLWVAQAILQSMQTFSSNTEELLDTPPASRAKFFVVITENENTHATFLVVLTFTTDCYFCHLLSLSSKSYFTSLQSITNFGKTILSF